MSGNLPFPFYSSLKTFFNATTYTSNLLWGVTQYITCFTIQLINNQRNKMETIIYHKHFCLELQLKTVFGLFKWLTFRSTTCTVRCGDQQLRFTHIVPTASSNSGVRHLLGTPQLFLLAVKVPLSRSRCGITTKRVCDGVERWEKRSW